MKDQKRRSYRHEVDPRLVWIGLGLAIAGSVVIAVGVIEDSVITGLVGFVVLLAGAGVAIRGGIIYDALPAAAFSGELEDVLHGRPHEGIAPGQKYDDPEASRDAVETSRRVALIESTGGIWRRGGRDGPAGSLMLILAATLVLAQWQYQRDTAGGLTDDYGETICAIVLGLAGLRCVGVNGVHRIAAVLAFLAGAWLIVQGLVFPHPDAGLAGVEVTCGVLAVLAGLSAGSEPAP